MTRDVRLYLEDILSAIELIKNSVKSKALFVSDRTLQDATIRRLEIIGEAVKHIPPQFLTKKIPWKDVAGMRDVLAHAYFNVTLEQVWLAVRRDLPILEEEIKKIEKKVK